MDSPPAPAAPGKPRRRPEMVFQEMPDGTGVVVDSQTGASYALNATGAEVWTLCDGEHTERDITAVLLERYDATEEEVARSVAALLAHLRQLGALD